MVKIKPLLLLLLLLVPVAFSADEISDEDKAKFDKILEPVTKIYNFVKYAATVIGSLFLVFSGFTFVTAGNDQHKRESAKTMAGYIVVGLIVIWIAPFLVSLVMG